ncbi:N-acetylneuraminic acid transporter [Aggregatibacter aphrophilus NJ8700]|nr:N-acetylneuraminic acid transporter [Aggregatibacter aphrophilus NJ8700]
MNRLIVTLCSLLLRRKERVFMLKKSAVKIYSIFQPHFLAP